MTSTRLKRPDRITRLLRYLALSAPVLVVPSVACLAQSSAFQTAPGGLPISASPPNWYTGFGNVNGFGAGIPAAGLTAISTGVTGGVLYATPYYLDISGAGGGNPAGVAVYVSTPFAHPTVLSAMTCYPAAICTSGASFTTISSNPAAPTMVIGPPGVATNGTVAAVLGLFVSNANGAGPFSDTATLTFLTFNSDNPTTIHKTYLNLTSPPANVQTVVRLQLGTAPGGLTISPAADYTADFGAVNGLGVGIAAAGLNKVPVSGGTIYSTPYLIQPAFCNASSTTASVSAHVSTNFLYPAILRLMDAAVPAGPYNAISTSGGSPTTLAFSAGSGASLTRYLGLFVSAANGSGTLRGPDNATMTYTLTVP